MSHVGGKTLYAEGMAQVRLFANLREIAGTSRLEIDAGTVEGVLDETRRRFGPVFAQGLETSRVWVNGSEAEQNQALAPTDEVVVLPPVSGGSQPVMTAPADVSAYVPLVLAAIAVFANMQEQPLWAAALVGVAALWAFDLNSAMSTRARRFAPLAVVTAATASVLVAHVLGGTGYGLSVAIAVAVGSGWAVAFPEYRAVDVFGPTALAAILASMATASVLLSRSAFSPDERAMDVFLVSTIVGVGLGAIVSGLPALPFVDRFTVTAIGAILAAIGAAAFWELDAVNYFLVGLVIAVGLVAGQGLSSMLRSGSISLTSKQPGLLGAVDGVMLAAAFYYPLLRLVF